MHTLGTEAIRAFFTLQCCWLNNEEIYLEQGCPDCSSAATYLIYHTNTHIQKHLLKFIEKYRCHQARRNDLLDLDFFQKDYEDFLHILEPVTHGRRLSGQWSSNPKTLQPVKRQQ